MDGQGEYKWEERQSVTEWIMTVIPLSVHIYSSWSSALPLMSRMLADNIFGEIKAIMDLS